MSDEYEDSEPTGNNFASQSCAVNEPVIDVTRCVQLAGIAAGQGFSGFYCVIFMAHASENTQNTI
jgi:hypothetical protein